jgi:hypothetical protein
LSGLTDIHPPQKCTSLGEFLFSPSRSFITALRHYFTTPEHHAQQAQKASAANTFSAPTFEIFQVSVDYPSRLDNLRRRL